MIQKVFMPKLGQTMEEATVERWLVKEGDQIKKGDILLEITTDKATLEVESYAEGTVLKTIAKEGDILPVNAVLAVVGEPGEEIPSDLLEGAPAAKAETAEPGAEEAPAAPEPAAQTAPSAAPAVVAPPTGRVIASPRARRLAKENKVNLRLLKSSGPGGRIVEEDVKQYIERMKAVKATPAAVTAAYEAGVDITTVAGSGPSGRVSKEDVQAAAAGAVPAPVAAEGTVEKLSAMRRVVAERMSQSKREIPHFYLTTDVDMTAAVEFRSSFNDLGKGKISFHDLLIRACAVAMREQPSVNVSWAGDGIRKGTEVNIGLAIALEEGLIVPVVRNADGLDLAQTAAASSSLIEKARGKRLTPDEYQGGCLTISNLGMFDVDLFIPVINPGESIILGLGRIAEKAIVRDGGIQIRKMMGLSLSGDHRCVDGAVAATFLKRVKELLESPKSLG